MRPGEEPSTGEALKQWARRAGCLGWVRSRAFTRRLPADWRKWSAEQCRAIYAEARAGAHKWGGADRP